MPQSFLPATRRPLPWAPFLLLVTTAIPLRAQVPEAFSNLEVLPRDIERGRLVEVMKGFSVALGVRCEHCHVAADPADFTTFDFASDARETKQVARVMMRMTRTINEELLPMTERDSLLEVRCVTCHHGQARPRTLAEALLESLQRGGLEAALARYRELRKETYGRGVYDFGEMALPGFAGELTRLGRTEEAEAFLRLDLEFHPGSAMTHYLLGEARLQAGDREGALESFRRARELAPESPVAARRIRELEGEGSPPPR